jgi:hypothetical protein
LLWRVSSKIEGQHKNWFLEEATWHIQSFKPAVTITSYPKLTITSGRGFHVTTESPKSDSLSLFRHGERAYDHVVLLPAKSKGLGPALTANLILDFMKKEGNILLALSSETATPTSVQSLLLELDIHIPSDKGALVVNHFNYDANSAAEKHDVLLLPYPQSLKTGVKNYFVGDGYIAVPRAVGQTLGNESPLLAPILRAPSTAYSYNPKDEVDSAEDPFATGSQLNLVSAMQAHNSARLAVLGSAEMLQNAWFAEKATLAGKEIKTANRDFAEKLSSWTFKETGVLKVGKLIHYLDEGVSKKLNTSVAVPENNPKIYRIKQDVVSLSTFPPELQQLLTHPGLPSRNLRIRPHAPNPLRPRRRRLPAARIQHALALPPPQPDTHQPDRKRHHLRRLLQDARPARHLQLPRQVQQALPHQHRGEAAGYGSPLCAR